MFFFFGSFRVIKIQNKCNATKINGNPKTVIGLLLHPSGTFPCPKCVAIWSGRRSQNSTPSKIGANVIKLVIMIFILFSFIFPILSQLTEPQHHFFHNRNLQMIVYIIFLFHFPNQIRFSSKSSLKCNSQSSVIKTACTSSNKMSIVF